jgi:glycosyltransferase involved in cell wall biosynthesis
MSTYNGERFLREAIESILSQSYRDFEYLIVDDCATDNTARIIHSMRDSRIRYLKPRRNLGYAAARNLGLQESKGQYVACMDHDDVSLPDRLERQARFLDCHPKVGLVACGIEIIDEWGRCLFRNDWGGDCVPINELVVRKPHFFGPTMFFRRECIERVGMYRPGLDFMEDYDLSIRIGEWYQIGMLGGIGYQYRLHEGSSSFKKAAKSVRGVILVRRLAEERFLTGTDCLSQLSEAKIRRFLRLYFYAYDRHEKGSLPLYYLLLARRFLLEGAWWLATMCLAKGIVANPFCRDTAKLVWLLLRDRTSFKKLRMQKNVLSAVQASSLAADHKSP